MFVRMKKTTRGRGAYYLCESQRVKGKVRQKTIAYLGPVFKGGWVETPSGCGTIEGAVRYAEEQVADAEKRIAEATAARDKALADYRALVEPEVKKAEADLEEARSKGERTISERSWLAFCRKRLKAAKPVRWHRAHARPHTRWHAEVDKCYGTYMWKDKKRRSASLDLATARLRLEKLRRLTKK